MIKKHGERRIKKPPFLKGSKKGAKGSRKFIFYDGSRTLTEIQKVR